VGYLPGDPTQLGMRRNDKMAESTKNLIERLRRPAIGILNRETEDLHVL
jgi:hypothetical protein